MEALCKSYGLCVMIKCGWFFSLYMPGVPYGILRRTQCSDENKIVKKVFSMLNIIYQSPNDF